MLNKTTNNYNDYQEIIDYFIDKNKEDEIIKLFRYIILYNNNKIRYLINKDKSLISINNLLS